MKHSTDRKTKAFLIVGLAGASFIVASLIDVSAAQTGFAPPSSLPEPPSVPANNQIANDVDARIAGLKAKLQLTAIQESHWPDLQSQLHDYETQQMKTAAAASRRDFPPAMETARPNDIVLLRKRADDMAGKAALLKKLADAADPFYTGLNDRQKDELFQYLGPELADRGR